MPLERSQADDARDRVIEIARRMVELRRLGLHKVAAGHGPELSALWKELDQLFAVIDR